MCSPSSIIPLISEPLFLQGKSPATAPRILGQVFLRKVYAVFDPGDPDHSGAPAVWLADQADPEIRQLQKVRMGVDQPVAEETM